MKHAKLLQILVPTLCLVFVQPVGSAGSAEQLQAIRTLLTERLVIMEQVAMFKWNDGLPINDKDREAIVLEKAISRAVTDGLVPKLATRVMTAQIAAAKAVQRELFRRWSAEGRGKHAEAPDLATNLRPKISRLSSELIAALVAARNDLDGCLARHVLKSPPAELVQFPKHGCSQLMAHWMLCAPVTVNEKVKVPVVDGYADTPKQAQLIGPQLMPVQAVALHRAV